MGGRAEGTVEELTRSLPCDFLMFRDRGLDPSRILVPTAGGPDSDLAGAIARHLKTEFESEVTLLHVAEDRTKGEQFLTEWANEHDLSDAELRVETGDIPTSITKATDSSTLLCLGATERGLLSRLLSGSVVPEVIEDVECSVLLAEKRHKRSLRERLFGTRAGTPDPVENPEETPGD